jgi:hypothetical protein
MRYLLMQGNRVANIVAWDGETDWAAPNDVDVMLAPDGVGIGWTVVGGEWTEPTIFPDIEVEGEGE